MHPLGEKQRRTIERWLIILWCLTIAACGVFAGTMGPGNVAPNPENPDAIWQRIAQTIYIVVADGALIYLFVDRVGPDLKQRAGTNAVVTVVMAWLMTSLGVALQLMTTMAVI